jgi:ligand-binding SRPBCC domain-containing protein
LVEPFTKAICSSYAMNPILQMRQVQCLPVPVSEAWKFFANPHNLFAITPAHLNLKVTNELEGDEIYPGQIITYKIRPLLRVPLSWMTEITHVEPEKLFVDEQRKGPYALWHHQHHFKAVDGGTEMTDIVHYRMPFGVFGRLGLPVVKKELRDLFAYRRKKIGELFGEMA